MKNNDLGSIQLKVTSIQKNKKRVIPKVKAKRYSESSRELNDIIEDNQETLNQETRLSCFEVTTH